MTLTRKWWTGFIDTGIEVYSKSPNEGYFLYPIPDVMTHYASTPFEPDHFSVKTARFEWFRNLSSWGGSSTTQFRIRPPHKKLEVYVDNPLTLDKLRKTLLNKIEPFIELSQKEKYDHKLVEEMWKLCKKNGDPPYVVEFMVEKHFSFDETEYVQSLVEKVKALEYEYLKTKPWKQKSQPKIFKGEKADQVFVDEEMAASLKNAVMAQAYGVKTGSFNSPSYSDSGSRLIQVCPGLSAVVDTCPQCRTGKMQLQNLIIHLNDNHAWPRVAGELPRGWSKGKEYTGPNIADWIEEYALLHNLDMTLHEVKNDDRNHPF